ncbi:MAG: GIY-YIG nuclease family protein [Candidatus Pacebacteria bacterium]|nr:GIY-YIG nuclease family protein [Candidatus Paceibacterota bacterium]
MYCVYILQSEKNLKYYTGSTKDLDRRLNEHNKGKGGYFTNLYKPWKLVYRKDFENSAEARLEEKKIKSYKGGNAFKRLIEN